MPHSAWSKWMERVNRKLLFIACTHFDAYSILCVYFKPRFHLHNRISNNCLCFLFSSFVFFSLSSLSCFLPRTLSINSSYNICWVIPVHVISPTITAISSQSIELTQESKKKVIETQNYFMKQIRQPKKIHFNHHQGM